MRPELDTSLFFNRCVQGKSILDQIGDLKEASSDAPALRSQLQEIEAQVVSLGGLNCPARYARTITPATGIPFGPGPDVDDYGAWTHQYSKEDYFLVVDELLIASACMHILNGDYDDFTSGLDLAGVAIEDFYQAINCHLLDFAEVSIGKTILESNLGLLDFWGRLLTDIEGAKKARPDLNTAIFFNNCRDGQSDFDLIQKYKRISANNPIILEKLLAVEKRLVALGARPCPYRFKGVWDRKPSLGIPF